MARRHDHTCIDMAVFDCKNCRNCKKCNKFKTCIFKVPRVLRRQNPEAYTPNVVCIGPYHRPKKESCGCEECLKRKECAKCKQFQDCTECKLCIKCKEQGKEEEEEFQLTERVKENYLNEFIRDTKTETLEKLMEKVIQHSDEGITDQSTFEKRALSFYAKEGISVHISPEDLRKMMIVDGCFLVQLLRKRVDKNLREEDDPIFDRDCMLTFLTHDILLLENQLPWFVLESLYSLIINIGKNFRGQSLPILALDAFAKSPSLKHGCEAYINHLTKSLNCHCYHNILHILDLIRSSIVIPSTQFDGPWTNDEVDMYDPDLHEMRTATSLSKAGIRFKCVKEDKTSSILDIEFITARILKNGVCNGVLKIPHFNVGYLTESLFRNLIAFEQCYPGHKNRITSYAIFMDNLISSPEDLELLCKAKVIGKWLSDEDGCNFFSDLYKGVSLRSFHYVDLCKQLNTAYKIKGYTWAAAFKTEKLTNPWTVAAFVIGLVVLALTIWSNINNIRRFMRK